MTFLLVLFAAFIGLSVLGYLVYVCMEGEW